MSDLGATSQCAAIAGERPAMIDRLCRAAVLRLLARLQHGELRVHDGREWLTFGRRDAECDLSAEVSIRSMRTYRAMTLGGFNGLAEAYFDGGWACDDLTALFRIFVRNGDVMAGTDGPLAWIANAFDRTRHALRRNTLTGSRRNISAHYDLGNEFFSLFLDDTLSYSCGIFERSGSTLREASVAKNERLCRKLDLRPSDHLLEIGTGWGGLALHAATRFGCRVTTTTISRRQFEFASERIRSAGLADRVSVLMEDYRALDGRFDKLVSVEMIEAVGHDFYDTYFEQCSRLLKPDGMMAIQAITIRDQIYEQARRTADFIKRFVFPGSCIPSIAALCGSMARAGDLKLFHLEDITPHYATTLRCWLETLGARRDDARRLGLTDEFLRMWEMYFCYCEAGFLERHIGSVQMVLTKPLNRRGPILAELGQGD